MYLNRFYKELEKLGTLEINLSARLVVSLNENGAISNASTFDEALALIGCNSHTYAGDLEDICYLVDKYDIDVYDAAAYFNDAVYIGENDDEKIEKYIGEFYRDADAKKDATFLNGICTYSEIFDYIDDDVINKAIGAFMRRASYHYGSFFDEYNLPFNRVLIVGK